MSEKQEEKAKTKVVLNKTDYMIFFVIALVISLTFIGGWVNNAIQSDYMARLTPEERKVISDAQLIKQQQEDAQKQIDNENIAKYWSYVLTQPVAPWSWVIGAFIFGLFHAFILRRHWY